MAAPASGATSTASRKIRRLGIGVILVTALYSAGWYYAANRIESTLHDMLGRGGFGSLDIACSNLKTGGFPFLIGFTCDKTAVEEPAMGQTLEAGALNVAARVYNPGTALIELEGPSRLQLEDGSTIEASWKLLRAKIDAGFSGLNSLSLSGNEVKAEAVVAALFQSFSLQAKAAEAHFRTDGDALDSALLLREFQWQETGGEPLLPPLSASVEAVLNERAGLLKGRPPVGKAMTGIITSLKFEMPGGLFGELSGPFSINDAGYMTGTFKTRLEKLGLWEEVLNKAFPEAQSTISGMKAMLQGLASGGDAVDVQLQVTDGLITLSMMPLGHIPPI
ncbi:DUF2125 domain-containing protein [Rhizobium alvei]|uniref:DUF2125 domain-containing protein n=1 Tax=Rhizobium alvei TaxID=1132659 RepID=A0ABT8YMN9_9HYPH|nr:DUF2125 domain-containing protein [Rhizobium alvei]MDO6964776.1 DUF2125 domain-containing protein [Rhizobium alvei]